VKPTLKALLDKNPCSDGVKFIKSHKSLHKMWATCERADWMIWALQQLDLLDDRTARRFAVACAEHTLHFFEDKYPDDRRPRHAIECARTLIDNPGATWSGSEYAIEHPRHAVWLAAELAAGAAAWSASHASEHGSRLAAEYAGLYARDAAMMADAGSAENKWQADKLRELINPFKVVKQKPVPGFYQEHVPAPL